MSTRYPALYLALQVFSMLMVGIVIVAPEAASTLNMIVAPCLIIFLGVPHGATDHRIFHSLFSTHKTRLSMRSFYLSYIGLMLLYAGLWYWSPTWGLTLFLGISAYHFGQSNWNYIQTTRPYILPTIYLLYGAMVLIVPILWHIEEATPILEAILGYALPPFNEQHSRIAISGTVLLNTLMPVTLWRYAIISVRQLQAELLHMGILLMVFVCCPLLLGFSIYFAAWHSLSSMQEQIRFFQSQRSNYGWRQYAQECLPYTLLAIAGLAGFVFILPQLKFEQGLGILFVFLSLITLPHMVLIDILYRDEDKMK